MSNSKTTQTQTAGKKPSTRTKKNVEVQEVKTTEVAKVEKSKAAPMVTQTTNAVFDPFYVPQADTLHYLEGYPKEWQADCSAKGGFRLDGIEKSCQEVKMEVLLFQEFRQVPFFWQTYEKTPIQDWGIVFFIDEDNKLSTTLLKGRSWRNFMKLVKNIGASGGNIGTKLVNARMVDATSKKGEKYKYVDFTHADNTPARIEKLKEFYLSQLVIQDGEIVGTRLYSHFVNELLESSKDFYKSEEYQKYLESKETEAQTEED